MNNDKIGYLSATFQAVLGSLNTDRIFQTVTFILSALTALITFIYNIWKWYKDAKKDGKISIDELEEGVNVVKDGISDLKDEIEHLKEDKENDNRRNEDNSI